MRSASWPTGAGLFESLHREHALTHLYFFDKNRVCLLRVHKPEKHGDLINRFTAIEAERTGKTASGIELGPLGTFTLRVVQPVFEGQTLLGYVELGKEIEDVLQALHTGSGLHVAQGAVGGGRGVGGAREVRGIGMHCELCAQGIVHM